MNQVDEAQAQQAQKEIARLFRAIEKDIPLYLFTQPGKNDVFSDAARQGIRFFQAINR